MFNTYTLATAKKSRFCYKCSERIPAGNPCILSRTHTAKFPLSICIKCGEGDIAAQMDSLNAAIEATKNLTNVVIPSARSVARSLEYIVKMSDAEIIADMKIILAKYKTDPYGYRSAMGRLIHGRKYIPEVAESILTLNDTSAILLAGFRRLPKSKRLKAFKRMVKTSHSKLYAYINDGAFRPDDILTVSPNVAIGFLCKMPEPEIRRLFHPALTARKVSETCTALLISQPAETANQLKEIFEVGRTNVVYKHLDF